MAYAVLASVRRIIEGLVNDSYGHISIVENSSTQILGLLYEDLGSGKIEQEQEQHQQGEGQCLSYRMLELQMVYQSQLPF